MIAVVLAAARAWAEPLAEQLDRVGLHDAAYAERMRDALTLDGDERVSSELRAVAYLWDAEAWDLSLRHLYQMPETRTTQLGVAYTQLRLGQPELASLTLAGSASETRAEIPVGSCEHLWLGGWAMLEQRQPAEAVTAWSEIGDDTRCSAAAREGLSVLMGWKRIPHRSPGVSAAMSAVVPGLGQAWSGSWAEATSSLLLNGGLVAGTVVLALDEKWVGAIVVGVIELAFYGGNLASAVDSARRFNRGAWARRLGTVAHLEPRLGAEGTEFVLLTDP